MFPEVAGMDGLNWLGLDWDGMGMFTGTQYTPRRLE